ncbi:MED22 [Drosophila busckii]|uniref:MED22 n=1 Tax=Drosophila busckii TaxID=30019 RepID=A0A0M4ETD2_DROBS|nr:MED22 [Drosophila busckii]
MAQHIALGQLQRRRVQIVIGPKAEVYRIAVRLIADAHILQALQQRLVMRLHQLGYAGHITKHCQPKAWHASCCGRKLRQLLSQLLELGARLNLLEQLVRLLVPLRLYGRRLHMPGHNVATRIKERTALHIEASLKLVHLAIELLRDFHLLQLIVLQGQHPIMHRRRQCGHHMLQQGTPTAARQLGRTQLARTLATATTAAAVAATVSAVAWGSWERMRRIR